jgi:hypothetical protein
VVGRNVKMQWWAGIGICSSGQENEDAEMARNFKMQWGSRKVKLKWWAE